MSILDQKPKSALKEGFGTKFGIGLMIALSVTLFAFQIKAPYGERKIEVPLTFEEGEIFTVEPIMSHQREKSVEPVKPVQPKQIQIVIGDPMPDPSPPTPPISDLNLNSFIPDEVINEEPVPEKPKPVRYAEVMPEFPGGKDALMVYLAGTPYCDAAIQNGYQGKIHVEFMVDTDGSIKNIKVLNKIFSCLDQAVKSRIEHMPKWTPGYMGKRAVPVIMVAPINFTLTN
jgi:hypothetical protein